MAIMVPICWGFYIYVKKIGSPIIDWLQEKERWWDVEDLDQNQYDNLSFLNQLGPYWQSTDWFGDLFIVYLFFSNDFCCTSWHLVSHLKTFSCLIADTSHILPNSYRTVICFL